MRTISCYAVHPQRDDNYIKTPPLKDNFKIQTIDIIDKV